MIIVRSPLRISLGGGGTDQQSYYQDYGGFVIAAAIDKYIYVTVNESFRNKISLKYSKVEDVDRVDEIEHPVIRESLKLLGITGSIDIDTISDIPAGTGMGSSGSFTTGLLLALHTYNREVITAQDLAEEAYHIEHECLSQPCGKQDQYAAAVGGLTCFNFEEDAVSYCPLDVSQETLANLEDGLMLFFTGYIRSSFELLSDQNSRSGQEDMLMNMHHVKLLGLDTYDALKSGNFQLFAKLMNNHWVWKKFRSKGMTNERIDQLYLRAMEHGALGGKLVGAGGGGFLMFYTEDKPRLRRAMNGLREVRFKFDHQGTSVMVHT